MQVSRERAIRVNVVRHLAVHQPSLYRWKVGFWRLGGRRRRERGERGERKSGVRCTVVRPYLELCQPATAGIAAAWLLRCAVGRTRMLPIANGWRYARRTPPTRAKGRIHRAMGLCRGAGIGERAVGNISVCYLCVAVVGYQSIREGDCPFSDEPQGAAGSLPMIPYECMIAHQDHVAPCGS